MLEDLHKTLRIYNISTGDNPFFRYEYHDSSEPSTEPTGKPTEEPTETGTESTKESRERKPEPAKEANKTNKLSNTSISPANKIQANKVVTQAVPANKTAPRTSDNTNIPGWITVVGASAGVLTTALVFRRKKNGIQA